VAAGFAPGADLGGEPIVVPQGKGTWGTAEVLALPIPATDVSGGGVNSVSCAAVGYCTAAGTYEDMTGNWRAFVATETAGKWGPGERVALGPDAPAGMTTRQELISVSCASAGNCVAGGYGYRGTTQLPYLVSQSGGAWGTPFAVSGESGQVMSVSCAGADDCAAVGGYSTPGGFAISEENGRWSGPRTFSGISLNSVSCAGVGTLACGAGGQGSDGAVTLDETAGTWGAPAGLKGSALGEQAESVSCAAAGACAAAGGGYNEGTGRWQAFTATEKNPVAGIYSDFTTAGNVTKATTESWPLLASVSGKSKGACAQGQDGVMATKADGAVEQVLSRQGRPYPGWISFWTPAVPSYVAKTNLTSMYDAGLAAGTKAAKDIEDAAGQVAPPLNPVLPAYVALDFDTSDTGADANHPSVKSCGSDVDPARLAGAAKDPKHLEKYQDTGDKQCWDWANPKAPANCWNVSPAGWRQFADGWAAGVRAATPLPLSPAIYANSSEYNHNLLGGYGLPVLLAVRFPGNPGAAGPVAGHIAFYGTCGAATAEIAKVRSWGALVNTIQFGTGSEVCAP
jgi:hypothetical protein